MFVLEIVAQIIPLFAFAHVLYHPHVHGQRAGETRPGVVNRLLQHTWTFVEDQRWWPMWQRVTTEANVADDVSLAQPGQVDLRTNLLHAAFGNEGNTCYINATILAVLWQVMRSCQEDQVPTTWGSALRQPQARFTSTFKFQLKFQLMGWPGTYTQHDVAEFASFLLSRST